MRAARHFTLLIAATALSAPITAAAPLAPSVPVPQLVEQVAIPHTSFKLANGLSVIVHEDRKAPIVAVSVWYNVGSKDEPRGQDRLRAPVRASDVQRLRERARRLFHATCSRSARPTSTAPPGSTAPIISRPCRRGALERALFLESDRMGHLLGAVTQEKLDNQRGVVQNEKRQGDNQPYGLVEYAAVRRACSRPAIPIITRRSARWPISTPRASPTCSNGSATNTARTTRCWCSPATSTPPTRGRWSSTISATSRAGPVNHPARRAVPTLPAPKSIVMKDHVADAAPARLGGAGPARRAARRARLGARCSAASPARGSTSPGPRRADRGQRQRRLQPFQRVSIFESGRREARRRRRRWSASGSTRSSPIMSPTARPRTRSSAP